MTKSKNIVYFDLETQKTAGDVGGWDRKDQMRMSVGVTCSSASGEYAIFHENRADDLVENLRRADLVVGFNVLNFDYPVLMRYTCLALQDLLPTLDLLVDLESRIGHRLALDAVAHATLGLGKTGDGLDAIRWWREGRVLEVAEYCCFDVKVTKLVHEFGCANREVFYRDRFGAKRRVAVDWSVP